MLPILIVCLTYIVYLFCAIAGETLKTKEREVKEFVAVTVPGE